MQSITATEAKNRLAAVMAAALKSPVMIEKNGQPFVVMMSAEEYEATTRKQRDKEQFLDLCDRMAGTAKRKGLTPKILRQILAGD